MKSKLARRELLKLTGTGSFAFLAGCSNISYDDGGENERDSATEIPSDEYKFWASAFVPTALKPDKDELDTDYERWNPSNSKFSNNSHYDYDMIVVPPKQNNDNVLFPVHVLWKSEVSEIDEVYLTFQIKPRAIAEDLPSDIVSGSGALVPFLKPSEYFQIADRYEQIQGEERRGNRQYKISYSDRNQTGGYLFLEAELHFQLDFSESDIFEYGRIPAQEPYKMDILIVAEPNNKLSSQWFDLAQGAKKSVFTVADKRIIGDPDVYTTLGQLALLEANKDDLNEEEQKNARRASIQGIRGLEEGLSEKVDVDDSDAPPHRIGLTGPTLSSKQDSGNN